MVRRVTVPAATRARSGRVAAYVLGETDALLVDPGGRTDDLDDVLDATDASHVAVTHHHPDHVGAVAEYAEAFDLTVWARQGRARGFERRAGIEPDRFFHTGDALPVAGETDVSVVGTPGHAPEHVAFRTPEGIISGDLAVAEGSVVVGAPEGDVRAYLTSLRRVYARAPNRLFPAHGPVIDDPRAVCARLIEHRLRRERKIRTAVAKGARTLDGILDAAYEKDLSGVEDLARATVVAHLEKLAVEGDLEWDGERVIV